MEAIVGNTFSEIYYFDSTTDSPSSRAQKSQKRYLYAHARTQRTFLNRARARA